MSRFTKLAGGACASLLLVLATAGTATADTATSLTVGPVELPAVPLRICLVQTETRADGCLALPTVQTLSMTVGVVAPTPEPAVTPPRVQRIPCPRGTEGVAVRVDSGSAAVRTGGSVRALLGDGRPTFVPLPELPMLPNRTVTHYACTGVQ